MLGVALICKLDVGLVACGARAAPRRRRPLVCPPPAVLAVFWRSLLAPVSASVVARIFAANVDVGLLIGAIEP